VSDAYVKLGYELKNAKSAFETMDIDVSDLGNVPQNLRHSLESALQVKPTVENLERYLPQIRALIIELLRGLKQKLSRIKSKLNKTPPQVAQRNQHETTWKTDEFLQRKRKFSEDDLEDGANSPRPTRQKIILP
jgi:hypothetical protein